MFGHVIRSNTMSKILLQGTIDGKRRRPKMQWQDNIVEWTGVGWKNPCYERKIEKDGRTFLINQLRPYGIHMRWVRWDR